MPILPPLTLLMTVYNGERFLEPALASARAQTLSDFEILIVDDGSTDNTAAILDKAAAVDRRIRILRLTHQGRVVALNRGFAEASGQWVAILDADDIAMPDRLERQARFLAANPQVRVLGGAIRYIDDAGRPGRIHQPPLGHKQIAVLMPTICSIYNSTAVLRKEDVLAVGGYRPAFPPAEDYDLWLRLIDRVKFANLPQILVEYRIHGGQITQTQIRIHALGSLAARVALARRRVEENDELDGVPSLTPQVLSRLGISTGQIDEATARNAQARVAALIDSGYFQLALAEMAQPTPTNLPRSVQADLELTRRLLRGLALRKIGRPWAALREVLGASVNGLAIIRACRRVLSRLSRLN